MINVAYVPVVIGYCFWRPPSISWTIVAVVFGSGVLKTSYSLYLQRGYKHGDFSLIYPLARGTGPLLSTLGAVALFGERPSPLVVAGGLVVVAGIFYLTGGMRWFQLDPRSAQPAPGARYGVISGVFIAAYTLWDRQGVARWLIPPVLYDAGTAFTQLCLLTPFAWKRRTEVVQE
jgi:drug/metabolite transporter (DMT)-like permease